MEDNMLPYSHLGNRTAGRCTHVNPPSTDAASEGIHTDKIKEPSRLRGEVGRGRDRESWSKKRVSILGLFKCLALKPICF